jgi:hypothetical protein
MMHQPCCTFTGSSSQVTALLSTTYRQVTVLMKQQELKLAGLEQT